MLRILILLTSTLCLLPSCVQLPRNDEIFKNMYNVSATGSSQFDGTKYVRVKRIHCGYVKFELYQDSNKAGNNLVLLGAGTNSTVNIGDNESLALKIDGKIHKFKSNDVTTEFTTEYYTSGGSAPSSMKYYLVPEAVVRSASESNELLVKLSLLNNKYIEGKCTPLTLAEAQQYNSELGLGTSQSNLDLANEVAGVVGFQKFIDLIDSQDW